jgi:hypothetical protein
LNHPGWISDFRGLSVKYGGSEPNKEVDMIQTNFIYPEFCCLLGVVVWFPVRPLTSKRVQRLKLARQMNSLSHMLHV